MAVQHQYEARVALADDATSVRRARHWLVEHLYEWGTGSVADAAELLVSELVTNAVRHAGTSVEVAALVHDHRLRVEVHDHGAGAPEVEQPNAATTAGRGLLIVEGLAEEWGWDDEGDGKIVWFELALSGATGA